MFVLNRHARRQHSEDIAQNFQLGIGGEFAIALCRGDSADRVGVRPCMAADFGASLL